MLCAVAWTARYGKVSRATLLRSALLKFTGSPLRRSDSRPLTLPITTLYGDAPAPVNLAARYPTCETLARYFAWALERRLASLGASDAKLVSVTVQLDDQSQELGHAVIALDRS